MELLSCSRNQYSSPSAQLMINQYEEKHIKEIKKQLKSSFPLIKSIESASNIQNIYQPTPFSSFKPIVRFQSQVSLDQEIIPQNEFTPRKSQQNEDFIDQSYELRDMYDSCLSKSIQNSIEDKRNENMIKFFQYLIAFKTNKIEQYQKQNIQQIINKQTQINSSSQSQQKRDSLLRSTTRDTKISQTLRQTSQDINQEINLLENLHHNYKCDICEINPISGIRYHCNICEDYDECQECHSKKNHNHLLQAIAKPGKYRQLQKIVNLLKKPNISNSSLAITRRGKENMKEFSINRSTLC